MADKLLFKVRHGARNKLDMTVGQPRCNVDVQPSPEFWIIYDTFVCLKAHALLHCRSCAMDTYGRLCDLGTQSADRTRPKARL